MLHEFAQQLQLQREAILGRWVSAVRADPKLITANLLEEIELRDHLGEIIARLAETLAANAQPVGMLQEPQLVQGAREDARLHGHMRARQHYRVDEMVREIGVLRSELLAFFGEYLQSGRTMVAEEFLRISQMVHRFFDEICVSSVTTYVTDRDQQAEKTQLGLRMLNEALEKQFVSASATSRRTLSTVAHEMATPVNALGLGVTYLAESDDPGERREARQLIGRTLDHLRTMLDQLLDFARADGGSEAVRVAEFAVRPLFEYLVAGFEPLAAARDLQFHADYDETLGSLCSDENKVQRIAVNLLSNAIKYTESGRITLSLRGVEAGYWEIVVTDTGCGIPEADLVRIFAEFQRLPAHSDKPGLGLGLSIVRNLAERLGGEVKVESEVGRGSRFTVILPQRL